MTLHNKRKYSNDVVNFSGVRIISKYARPAATESAFNDSKDILAYQGDDATPLNYNETYIGGNHGANVIQQIATASHGKATADIGSEWIDDKGTKWYIMRIVDLNTLWLLSQNIGAAQWKFAPNISGSTLTHSAKAINSSVIKFTEAKTVQLCPATSLHSKRVLLNGVSEIRKDGVYAGESITIMETYSIPNVGAVLNHAQSKAGLWENPPKFNDNNLEQDVRINIVYQFHENGSCTVLQSILAYRDILLNYAGGIQAGPLNYDGQSLVQYIPKTLPAIGKTKTWNFAAQEDITAGTDIVHLPIANWIGLDCPPDRMAQIVRNGNKNKFGFILGYSSIRGIDRATNTTDGGFIYTSKKQYPIALNSVGKKIPANNYYEIVAYRCFFNSGKIPEATVFTWYYDGSDIVVIMDFHQSVTALSLPLPTEFTGKKIELMETGGTFDLLSKEFVSPDGLLVTVKGYGYGIVKLTQ